jgi:hypothetical protein
MRPVLIDTPAGSAHAAFALNRHNHIAQFMRVYGRVIALWMIWLDVMPREMSRRRPSFAPILLRTLRLCTGFVGGRWTLSQIMGENASFYSSSVPVFR